MAERLWVAVTPRSYRLRVLWIMAIGVETKTVPEACPATELILRRIFDQCDEALMNSMALPEDLGQRKVFLLFCCLRVESVDTVVRHRISRWFSAAKNKGQML